MGNQCLRDQPLKECRKSFVDEFHAFEQLNNENAHSILNQANIKEYKLLKVLGRGGFGKVMLVQHSKH